MIRRTITSAAVAAMTLAAACSPDATPFEPSSMQSDGAALFSTPYEADASVVALVPGATHQLSLDKTANGKSVPMSSVVWSSSNELVATVSESGLVTAGVAGEAIVSATRGAHRVDVTIIVGGCGLRALPAGITTASISATDCVVGPFLADLYTVNTAVGDILQFDATGIVGGQLGIKVPGAELLDGPYQSIAMGFGARVIGNGNPLHVFARATTLGDYTITRSAPIEAHDCDVYNFLLVGSAFSTTLAAENSCAYDVEFGSIPEAVGMPLHAHYFNMHVVGGQSYTVTITGVSDTFNPALTVFGGGVLGQSAPDGNPAPSSRTVTFSRPTSGYVGIEVSSGRFVGGIAPENWVIEHGAYSMTVSQ